MTAKIRGYLRLLGWLIRDLVAHYRWRTAYLAAVGGLQILARYGALGVLFGFLRLFEQDKQGIVLGITLPEPRSVPFLLIATMSGALLLILAAYFRYEVHQRALFIGKAYEVFCLRRLFSLAGRLPHRAAPVASRIVADGSIKRYPGYARHAGRLAWRLGQTFPSAMSLVLAAIILLWLDAGLTAGLAVLTVLVVAIQYPANRKAATASKAMEDYSRHANRRMREVLNVQQASPVPIELDASDFDAFFQHEDVRRFMKGHRNRVRAMYQAGLASEIGSAILLVGAIIAMGLGILLGELTFAHAIVYIGVTRFMLKDFVRVSKGFARINRFHRQIEIYRDFVRDATKAAEQLETERVATESTGDLAMDCTHLDADDDARRLKLSLGHPCALLTPPTGRGLPSVVLNVIAEEGEADALPPFTIDAHLAVPESSLRFNLGLPLDDSENQSRIAEALKAFGCSDAASLLARHGLQANFQKTFADKLSLDDRLALNAIGAKLRGHRIYLIESGQLVDRPSQWRDQLFRLLAEDYVIVIHREVESIPALDEDKVLICDGVEIIGWLETPQTDSERERLERIFANIAAASAASGGGFVDDEDDDDE